ncbi:PLP-dependent aminotransferase family protein [Corynebacterium yudongzhengii]|uniref:PLP-dependent aminotransferase family protein n=1 Tax=Corynebacterium yudongzhengii TaxID=2080740 RepID=A0A2U1T8Y6_9CORY|nr:PLP-dependent aminotransferase family protein [Corynebacterium yudongzhengii]AWB82495.1 PLP-dependent aminotransferase family protein [Corynebacterium yudongzhengii]PWC02449.1 PLP-dependent aminotransferase family protein [Corynebacterium yudongzhengii]
MTIPARIARELRERITAGELSAGDRLESTRVLARQMGVSRGSVVAAYEQLVGEGYLDTTHGGTRVSAASAPRPRPTAPTPVPKHLRPGLPDGHGLTTTLWRSSWRAAAADPQAHPVPGSHRLRSQLAEHLRLTRSVVVDEESLLVTAGVRDGLTLLLQALDPAGTVAVEDPGLPTLRRVPAALGRRVVPVSSDEEGIRIADLERLKPQVVIVMPNHQYPLGTQMAFQRRLELLEWARDNGAFLVEDDYDSELRRAHPALVALDPGLDRVAMLGSFAKTLSPALGLGYLIAPEALRERVFALATPVSGIVQDAMAEFLAHDGLRRHTARMRREYRRRQRLFREVFPAGHAMDGGLHAVIEVADEAKVVRRARARGFGVEGLGQYWSSATRDGIVLGLGSEANERLRSMLVRLREVIEEG